MAKDMRITDSRDALFLEGAGMIAFGMVTVCHSVQAIQTMLVPFGILLFLNGISRVLLSAWFYQSGSPWRRLSQSNGWSDFALGLIALSLSYTDKSVLTALFATWLLLSGYYHLRRYYQLQDQWPGSFPLAWMGGISILGGLLLWGNEISAWTGFAYSLSALAVLIGAGKSLAALKLGQMHKRWHKKTKLLESSKKVESRRPLSSFHFN